MTDLIVEGGGVLYGTVRAPPSKAYTHRAIIASTLSIGESTIKSPLICDDTVATMKACSMLGAKMRLERSGGDMFLKVLGSPDPVTPQDVIDCGGSGSTLRFLTPVCALAEGISVLTGDESLRKRPMGPLLKALRDLGVRCYSSRLDGYPPIIVFGGGIKGGTATIRGDISSQFISGLLFASPRAKDETEIKLSTDLESKPYVKMTLEVIGRHGVKILTDENYKTFKIPPRQEYKPTDHKIEGDYSSAAFLMAAAAITGSKIKIENLKLETFQGDRIIIEILRSMGVKINTGSNYVEVDGVNGDLMGVKLDLKDSPDLVPVCAALASSAKGETVIRGVKRLRFKESDRVKSILSEFPKLGVKVTVNNDELRIYGNRLRGAILDSHNDHRIAMACIVAALKVEGQSIIRNVECINKSYPNFIKDLKLLGGRIVER